MTSRFVLERTKEPRRSGLGAYLKALRKYDIEPTKHIQATEENKIVFKDRAKMTSIADDIEYLGKVLIGTPPQAMYLQFDSGSSDLWVDSSYISANERGSHHVFNPDKSSTFKTLPGYSWIIQYAAGGVIGNDEVTLGDIKIHKQAVQVANVASKAFLADKSDGILGLAWPSINTAEPELVLTPMVNMIRQGLLNEAVFACKLSKEASSEFTFGYIDETAALGRIAYTLVSNKRGFWEVPSAIATINGEIHNRPQGNSAIVDTGTTLIMLDDEVVGAIYAQVPGARYDERAGGYLVPKGSVGPTVELAVGDELYQIPGGDLAFAPISEGSDVYFGAIQSRGSAPHDVLGDVFLKCVYAVFDQGNVRFGCAKRPDVVYDTVKAERTASETGKHA